MAYDKYIKRNGKTYGPYTYHSRRVNGKVVSEYHGSSSESSGKNKFLGLVLPLIGAFLILVFVGYVLFNGNFNLTGQAVLNLEGAVVNGTLENADVLIELDSGELIPSNSKVTIQITDGNETEDYEFELKDLVSDETVEGDYYITTALISGSGEGYGVPGKKIVYPEVEFILEVLPVGQNVKEDDEEISDNENTNVGNSNNQNSENGNNDVDSQSSEDENVSGNNESNLNEENETSNLPVENNELTNQTSEDEEVIVEESSVIEETSEEEISDNENSENGDGVGSENSEDENANGNSNSNGNSENAPGITGAVTGSSSSGVVSGFFYKIFSNFGITGNAVDSEGSYIEEVEGAVDKDNSFEYKIKPGESVRIKEGSVSSNSNSLDESVLNLNVNGINVLVTTEYSEEVEGFGFEYSGENKKELGISLKDLGIDLSGKENYTLNIKVEYQNETIFLEERSVSDLIDESENELPEEFPEEILNETSNETVTNITTTNETIINETIVEFEEELVLTEDEIEILVEEFGNSSVITSKAERVGDRVLIRLELGDYWVEHSYADEGSLDNLIEKDRITWLKQLADSLSSEDSNTEEVEDLIKDYPLNSNTTE